MSHSPLVISLTGPESSGKTTLATALAAHFGAPWVPEFARAYLEKHGPRYSFADFEAIAHSQLAAEDAAAAQAPGLLFCDSDILTLKIWAESAYGACPPWLETELHRPRYALTLLLVPDLPWAPDPLREHPDPADRGRFYAAYKANLQTLAWPFVEISGPLPQRLARAVEAVQSLL